MAQFPGGKSNLNPNAPLFVPASFRQVEDFSPEWWQLITTSTWYKEYWLSQQEGADGFYNNHEDDSGKDIIDLLPDSFDLVAGEDPTDFDLQYEEFVRSNEAETANRPSLSPSAVDIAELQMKNLNLLQSSPKSTEKPVKDSSPNRVSSGIQQPH